MVGRGIALLFLDLGARRGWQYECEGALFTVSTRPQWTQRRHRNSLLAVDHTPVLQPVSCLFSERPVLASENPPGLHHCHLSIACSTNYAQHSPSWKPSSLSEYQRILHLEWNLKVRYHVHIGLPNILEPNEFISHPQSLTLNVHLRLLIHMAPLFIFCH
jgi:hypothetical protein